MKLLPTAIAAPLLTTMVVSCGGDNHPAPLTVPTIASQPDSQTMYSGGTASFSIAVNGNPAPSVIWQRSNDNGATWNTISGATSATYNFTVQPADTGAQFRAVATNSQGNVLSAAATVTEVPAVYAGGRIDVTNLYSGYWINGTWVQLSNSTASWGYVDAISVSGNRVFAAGETGGVYPNPTGYWVDGTWIDLALPSGSAYGIVYSLVVSGNDLYLGGILAPSSVPGPSVSGYWLNGTWNGLPLPPGADVVWPVALAVSGSDVYLAGWKVSNGTALPGYWVDGTWVDLPLPPGTVDGIVESIAVSGGNVYASGYADPTGNSYYAGNPGYWLNGNWVGLTLPAGQTSGSVTSLVVSGTDVYAAGFCESASDIIPGYWLNGTWNGLSVPFGMVGGVVTSLVLSGGKVYAGGYRGSLDNPVSSLASFSSTVPGYWVNGAWVGLPIPSPGTGYSSVYSLAVVP
jgi:hypothetical protein